MQTVWERQGAGCIECPSDTARDRVPSPLSIPAEFGGIRRHEGDIGFP